MTLALCYHALADLSPFQVSHSTRIEVRKQKELSVNMDDFAWSIAETGAAEFLGSKRFPSKSIRLLQDKSTSSQSLTSRLWQGRKPKGCPSFIECPSSEA